MARSRGKAISDRARIALAVACFLVGAAFIAYPYVSDYVNKLNQAEVIQNQDDAVGGQTREALQQELEASLLYNERLKDGNVQITDPFDPNYAPVTDEEYEARLNIAGDGVMGTIVIPSVGARVPIYHGTSDDVLQKGAGHLQATSLPVGGEGSHCVVAGHNGLPDVRIFDDLDKVKAGDYFVVQVLGEDHAYRVTSTEVVEPEDTSSLVIEEGRDLMTLVTCTPYGVNTHRLLVHGERCEVPAEWYERDKEESEKIDVKPERAILPLTVVGVAVGLGFAVSRVVAWRRASGNGPRSAGGLKQTAGVRDGGTRRGGPGKEGPVKTMPAIGAGPQGVGGAGGQSARRPNPPMVSPMAAPTRGVNATASPARPPAYRPSGYGKSSSAPKHRRA